MVSNKVVQVLAAMGVCLITSACMAQPQDDHNPQPQAVHANRPFKEGYKRATHYHGINAPNGQLKDQLEPLERKAVAGDTKAAASLYAALVGCKTMNDSVKVNFNKQCAGVTSFDMDSSGKWLTIAAQGGDADAQYAFAAGGYEQVIGSDISSTQGQARYEAYRSSARDYLIGLSQQCNIDAVAQISRDAWSNGPMFGGKAAPAIAYEYAVINSMLSSDATHSDQLVRALEGKLSSSDNVFALREKAAKFVDQYCK